MAVNVVDKSEIGEPNADLYKKRLDFTFSYMETILESDGAINPGFVFLFQEDDLFPHAFPILHSNPEKGAKFYEFITRCAFALKAPHYIVTTEVSYKTTDEEDYSKIDFTDSENAILYSSITPKNKNSVFYSLEREEKDGKYIINLEKINLSTEDIFSGMILDLLPDRYMKVKPIGNEIFPTVKAAAMTVGYDLDVLVP